MRTCLLAFGCYILSCSLAYSQSVSERKLYETLLQDKKSGEAIDVILDDSEKYTGIILLTGAAAAFKADRLEDGAFLFYAGRLRVRFDREHFPAARSGGDSPFVAYSAVIRDTGSVINPAVMAKPKEFAKVIARLKDWSPMADADYDPGYEFKQRNPETESQKAFEAYRKEYIEFLDGVSTLLNDSEYFSAFQIMQAFNLSTGEKRPLKQNYDKAVETIKRIEKEKGIKGIFTK